MALIKGISIVLYEKVIDGEDAFNRPIYAVTPVEVQNVLVCPVSSADAVDTLNLSGKTISYELCIPKGDAHEWENAIVEFYGEKWKTVGIPTQTIDELTPLDWNKKIKVERYE